LFTVFAANVHNFTIIRLKFHLPFLWPHIRIIHAGLAVKRLCQNLLQHLSQFGIFCQYRLYYFLLYRLYNTRRVLVPTSQALGQDPRTFTSDRVDPPPETFLTFCLRSIRSECSIIMHFLLLQFVYLHICLC